MFPAASSDSKSESANTTTQPETWSEAELRRWLKKVIHSSSSSSIFTKKKYTCSDLWIFFFANGLGGILFFLTKKQRNLPIYDTESREDLLKRVQNILSNLHASSPQGDAGKPASDGE